MEADRAAYALAAPKRVEDAERVSHSRQIVGLDLVRFAAACLVMFFHFGFWMWAGPAESITSRAAGVSVRFPELTFLSFGRVGVEIFFVISGFIIAYSARTRLRFSVFSEPGRPPSACSLDCRPHHIRGRFTKSISLRQAN